MKTSKAVIVQPSSNPSKPMPQKQPTPPTQTKASPPSPIEALPPDETPIQSPV